MNGPRTLLLSIALTLAVSPPAAVVPAAAAAQAPAADITALTTRLETAALDGDVGALKAARLACLRLLAASSTADRTAILRYTVAYAGWRLIFMPGVTEKEQGDLLDDARTQLDAVIAADARHAEALGLLSAVYGAQIGRSPDLGMTLGPLSGQMLGRALGIDPQNPRLLVMQAQSQFHTPPEYGGSIRDAEATLRRAVQRFEKEPATKPWPNWGRFDAHAWLGQCLAHRNDKAGARAHYELALKIAPNSAWVKQSLLPAVR
jgi:hypothetical protein